MNPVHSATVVNTWTYEPTPFEGIPVEATDTGMRSNSANVRRPPWTQVIHVQGRMGVSLTNRGNAPPSEGSMEFNEEVLHGEEASFWAAAGRRALKKQWDDDHSDGSEDW